jgi:flagellar biosynthesis GTPase FlhF
MDLKIIEEKSKIPINKVLNNYINHTNTLIQRKPSTGIIQTKRKWIIRVLNKEKVKSEPQVDVNIKIRGEEASCYVPDKLYSSHKYVVDFIAKGSSIEEYSLIISKIKIIKAQTNEEVLKNNNPIVKGTLESALTKKSKGLEGTMRIQFTSNSYHHGKGLFLFFVTFYDPIDTNNPIFTMESPSFRVYARKPSIGHETLQPNKLKVTTKKRKRVKAIKEEEEIKITVREEILKPENVKNVKEKKNTEIVEKEKNGEETENDDDEEEEEEDEEEEEEEEEEDINEEEEEGEEGSPKKQKYSKTFEEFQKKLVKLVQIKQSLENDEQLKANEKSLEKLLSIDPNYTIDYFLKPTNQQNIVQNE